MNALPPAAIGILLAACSGSSPQISQTSDGSWCFIRSKAGVENGTGECFDDRASCSTQRQSSLKGAPTGASACGPRANRWCFVVDENGQARNQCFSTDTQCVRWRREVREDAATQCTGYGLYKGQVALGSNTSPENAKYRQFMKSMCACTTAKCKRSIRGEERRWRQRRGPLLPRESSDLAPTVERLETCEGAPAESSNEVPTATAPPKLGIPECDEFIEKLLSCIGTASSGINQKSIIDALTKAAESSALSAEAREAMAKGCKTAALAAQKSGAYAGCVW